MMELNSVEENKLDDILLFNEEREKLIEENERLHDELDLLNVRYERLREENYRLNDEQIQDRSTKVGAPVIFDNSHAFQEMVSSLKPENEKKEKSRVIKNKWTKENEETVKKWQIDIEKTSFVYGEVLMTTTFYMNFILVVTLLMSVLNTLFAALSVTLITLDMKWPGITFEILILICSSIAAVMTGLLKIFALDLRVQNLTRYVEKLDNSWFLFEIELNIPPGQRSDAHDFIKRADGQYLSLMQQSLPIDAKEYSQANRKFQERLLDNHLWSRKFKKQMEEQMEELV